LQISDFRLICRLQIQTQSAISNQQSAINIQSEICNLKSEI